MGRTCLYTRNCLPSISRKFQSLQRELYFTVDYSVHLYSCLPRASRAVVPPMSILWPRPVVAALQGPCEGILVIKRPWPSMMRTVAGDHKRFEQTYFSAFKGYYFTGEQRRHGIWVKWLCNTHRPVTRMLMSYNRSQSCGGENLSVHSPQQVALTNMGQVLPWRETRPLGHVSSGSLAGMCPLAC